MRILLTFFIAIMSLPMFAQMNVIYVDAYVLDGETQQPIEFVNINILDRNYGTVTLDDGSFKLEIIEDQIGEQDKIKITAIGYATKEMTLKRFYNLLENNNVIYLNPYNTSISKETLVKSKEQEDASLLNGRVMSDGAPIMGATVAIKGSYIEAKTDYEGRFKIQAQAGDVLRFDYLTTLPKEAVAKNGMNVSLEADGELLDEVELRARQKREAELGSREIITAYGTKDYNSLGYSASQITAAQIPASYVVLGQALNRMLGVVVLDMFGPNPVYAFSRSLNTSVTGSSLPIVIIDDMIYEQGVVQIPPIDVQNVASITTIPGINGSIKYGTLGRNGVIIIRTKTYATAQGEGMSAEEKTEALKATGNDYEGEAILMYDNLTANYADNIAKAKAFEAAKEAYISQSSLADTYGVDYYIVASRMFEKWDQDYAAQVAMEILNAAPKNPKALKSLAYRLLEMDRLEEAKQVYQRIALLTPNDAQSYRDLAYMYKETGEYVKAFSLYKLILDNDTPGLDFSGIREVAEAEMRHLVTKNRDKVNFRDLPNSLLNVGYEKDLRIVFEWNDPSAEFDIQFVNPEGKYFTHKQSRFDNLEAMKLATSRGFAIEQFEIDDDQQSGKWLINLESLNPEVSINPTFLKYTIYRNYATSQETKEVRVVNLSALDQKITLTEIEN